MDTGVKQMNDFIAYALIIVLLLSSFALYDIKYNYYIRVDNIKYVSLLVIIIICFMMFMMFR